MNTHAAQQSGARRQTRRSAPVDRFPSAFEQQAGAGFGVGTPRQRQQHGRRMLHRAPQTEPGSERDAARRFGRGIAQVQGHQPEAAALDQQIGGFERVIGAARATHPEQALQAYAGRGGGSRIEGILGIHQSADFLARGGAGERGDQEAGTAGRSRTKHFRQAAARQAAGGAIQLGNPAGDQFQRGADAPFERAVSEEWFELFFENRRAAHFRFLFACTIFLQDEFFVKGGTIRPVPIAPNSAQERAGMHIV